jgi:hypothetical protein
VKNITSLHRGEGWGVDIGVYGSGNEGMVRYVRYVWVEGVGFKGLVAYGAKPVSVEADCLYYGLRLRV